MDGLKYLKWLDPFFRIARRSHARGIITFLFKTQTCWYPLKGNVVLMNF